MARSPLQPGETGKVFTRLVRPGVWRADATYRDLSGAKHRLRKSGRTEAVARRALLSEIAEVIDLEEARTGPVDRTTRVQDGLEHYFANRMEDARNGIGRASTRSVRQYRSIAENWIVPYLGELPVRQLTAGRLDAYFRRDIPPTRYTDVRKNLHAFVKWLIVRGALQHDPVANLPSYQQADSRKRSRDREVTATDIRDVLRAIDAWMVQQRQGPRGSTLYRDLVLFMAGTACRPGEALAMRREDLDFDFTEPGAATRAVAHITGTIVYDRDNGGLHRQAYTKGRGAGDRTVTLPTFVVSMLRRRLMAEPPNPNNAVFATRNGTWVSLNNVNTRLRESILKDTDVGEWFELRLLRSATGTIVAHSQGAEAAAAQMGNTRQIAEAHYIHRSRVAPDHSELIEAAWGPFLGASGARLPS